MIKRPLIILCALLAGCGSGEQSEVRKAIQQTINSVRSKPAADVNLEEQRAAIINLVQQANSTDPVLLVELTDRKQMATLGLVTDRAGTVSWFDATGVSVSTKNGIVTSTRGLANDLMSSEISGTLKALSGFRGTYSKRQRYLNGEGQLEDVVLTCSARQSAATTTETCTYNDLTLTNSYVTRSGTVVDARQWLGPDIGYSRITRLQ